MKLSAALKARGNCRVGLPGLLVSFDAKGPARPIDRTYWDDHGTLVVALVGGDEWAPGDLHLRSAWPVTCCGPAPDREDAAAILEQERTFRQLAAEGMTARMLAHLTGLPEAMLAPIVAEEDAINACVLASLAGRLSIDEACALAGLDAKEFMRRVRLHFSRFKRAKP